MASTERDNAGLEADIGITLGKLTKQLASAEVRMVKAAKKYETDFANANRKVSRGFDQMGKSAQGSANAMGKEMDRLRAKYDPIFAASKRYEASLEELNRAHKVGALNAAQHERALENLNLEYERSTSAVSRAAVATARWTTVTRGGAGGIQNVAYQVGDFAVQVGAGTSASIALGQQLPQLLSGFGVLGAVMGATVAVGIPLVRMLVDTMGAGVDLEKKLKELEEAVNAYSTAVQSAIVPTDELREKYGTVTAAAQTFIAALVEINEVAATGALSSTIQDIAEQFGKLTNEMVNVGAVNPLSRIEITSKEIAKQLELTADQALVLSEGLRKMAEAEGPQAQANAAAELLETMKAILGPIDEMSEGAQKLAGELADVGIQAGIVQGNIEDTNFSVQDLVSGLAAAANNMGTLISQAASLGDNMYRAASAAWEFLGAQGQARNTYDRKVGRGRGGDPRQFGGSAKDIQKNVPAAQLAATEAAVAKASRKAAAKAAKSGGKGGGSKKKAETSLYATGERTMQNLERQIELIGKTRAEIIGLTSKYRMLDEAKKRGIDLDAKQTATGKSVRETIDEQAVAIENLYKKYEAASERAKFFSDIQDDLKQGLLDSIVEGESFADVLSNIAKKLARAALEAALFNEGIFAQKSNGGGLLGGLFAGAKKLFSFDGGGHTGSGPRTGGVDGKGGFPAILHPNETVVDHTKGQRLGGGVNVSYQIDARGADVGAVQRIEVALAKTKAELPSAIIKTMRNAPKMNIKV